MSKTLSLLDSSLSKARHLQGLGRSQNALPILRRLCKYPELPVIVAAEIQQLLGEAFLDLGQFRASRRHLRAALRLEEQNATTHHLLALAIQNDAECNSSLAGRHHRKALELAPNEAVFLADAGAYFVETGKVRGGLGMLRRAGELLPDDFEILRSLIDALCEARHFEDARKTLNGARFRFAHDARFASLTTGVELSEIRERQRDATSNTPATASAKAILLPFNGAVAGGAKPVRAFRRDAARSRLGRPHLLRRFDAGQAQ